MASSFESVFKLLSADIDSLSDPDLQDFASLQIAGLVNSERKNTGMPALARDENCDRAASDVLARPMTALHTTVRNHNVIGCDFNYVNLEQQCSAQIGSSKNHAVDCFKNLLGSLDPNGRRFIFSSSITHFGIAAERNSASIYRVCIIVFRKALTIFHISHKASEGIVIHGKFLDPNYSLYAVAVHDERNSLKAGYAGPKQIQYKYDTQDFSIKVVARLMQNRSLTCKVLEFIAVEGDGRNLNYGSGPDINSVNESTTMIVHKMRFTRLWESNLLYEARSLSDSQFILDEYNSKSNIPRPSTQTSRTTGRTPSWANSRDTPLRPGVSRPLPTIAEVSRSQQELPHWSQTDRNKPEVVSGANFPQVASSFGVANENLNPLVEPDRFPPPRQPIGQGLPNSFGQASYSNFPSKPLTINTAFTPTNSSYPQQTSHFSFPSKPGTIQPAFPPQSGAFPSAATFPPNSSAFSAPYPSAAMPTAQTTYPPQVKSAFPTFQPQGPHMQSGYPQSSTGYSAFPTASSGQPSAFPTTSSLSSHPGQSSFPSAQSAFPSHPTASAFPSTSGSFHSVTPSFPSVATSFPSAPTTTFPSTVSAFPSATTSGQQSSTTQSAFPTTNKPAFAPQQAFQPTSSQSAFPSQPTTQASSLPSTSFPPGPAQQSSFQSSQSFKPPSSGFFVSPQENKHESVKLAENFDRYLSETEEDKQGQSEYVNLSCLILAIPRKLFEEVRCYVTENPAYRKLYETMEYSDVAIRVQNSDIRAHKAVLCASSHFFRDQLDRIKALPTSLQTAKLIMPSTFTEASFKIALKFMYSLNIDLEHISLATAKELLVVAEALGLPTLVKVTIVKFICTQITREDVLSTLKLATAKTDVVTQLAWEYLEDSCALFAAQQSQWLVRNRRAECLTLPLNLLFRVLEYSVAHANSSEQVANVIKLLTDLRYADNVFELANKLSYLYLLGYKDYSCDIRHVDLLKPYTKEQLSRLNPNSLMEHPTLPDCLGSTQARMIPGGPPMIPPSVNAVLAMGERSSQLALAVGSTVPKTVAILKDRDLRARASKPTFTFTVADLSRPRSVVSCVFSSLSRLWSLVVVIEQTQHLSLYLCERGSPDESQSPLFFTSVLFELEVQDQGMREARVSSQPNYSACFFSFPNGQGFSAGERNYCRLNQLRDPSRAVVSVYIKEVNLHSSLLHYITANCDTLFGRNSEAFCAMSPFNLRAVLFHDQLNVKSEREAAKIVYNFASKQPVEVVETVIPALRLQHMPFPDLLNVVRDHTRIRQSALFQRLFEAEMARRLTGQPITEAPRAASKMKAELTQPENMKALTNWLLTAPHHEGYERRLEELKHQLQAQRQENDKKLAELHSSRLEMAKELERTRSLKGQVELEGPNQEPKTECSVM